VVSLVLVRVDCRLIHGQVIEAWLPFTSADCLIVANDEAADDPLQRTIMEMAVPPGIEAAVLSVGEAVRRLKKGEWSDRRVMLLVASPGDALECLQEGLHFNRLNLGNLVGEHGTTPVTCSISLDESDRDVLQAIHEAGVLVEARPVPRDNPASLESLFQSRRPA
jgi:PTS system mannose-specific IIB component